jgi:hypothetical protein
VAIFTPLFEALATAEARYVVVGGLAVVLHGHARLTADADLVVDPAPDQARRAVDALTALGLRPRVPVAARDFVDPPTRESWIRDKGMRVLSFWDPANPMRVVDLFVEHPIPFDDLWRRSEVVRVDGTPVRVACIADLIALKRLAGRPLDLADIEALQEIQRRRAESDG